MFLRMCWLRLLNMDNLSLNILWASMVELDELIAECWRNSKPISASYYSKMFDERADRYARFSDSRPGDSGTSKDSGGK
jgi:hypothetical protein